MTFQYIYHGPGNLHVRPDFAGLDYSDGPEAERRIREAVQAATDRSTFSGELVAAIADWPSEYHLSRQRHCLVRPLGVKPGDRVLELGCGCGAITRYLGELGAEVVGVEGALARARIAAERCRDLPNVTIFAENLTQFTSQDPFDWVLLVGVLEYAPLFAPGDEPLLAYLRCARAFLAPKGRLVVAIENKLGLKYFNGSAEDHLGVPFVGLQGLYGDATPYTPGRHELNELLQSAGFHHTTFLYPFPDYKLPRVILTDRGVSDAGFHAWDMLALAHARDYAGVGTPRFDEALVLREAARNGVLGDLSNSLLAVARQEPGDSDAEEANLLACAFSVQRAMGLAVETRIARGPDGIGVTKTMTCPGECRTVQLAGGRVLENTAADSAYVRGELVLWRLWAARARGGGQAEIVEALAPWFDFLMAHAGPARATDLARLSLPRNFLDMTPFNLMDVGGVLEPIDLEWVLNCEVPLGWVVTRSLLGTLWGVPGFEREPVDLVSVIEALCARHGLTVAGSDIEAWIACERDLQARIALYSLPELTLPLTSRSVASSRAFSRPMARLAVPTVIDDGAVETLQVDQPKAFGVSSAQLAQADDASRALPAAAVAAVVHSRLPALFDGTALAAAAGDALATFNYVGIEWLELLIRWGCLGTDGRVLDIGCGAGRMAVPLALYLSEEGHYTGFDVLRAPIEKARKAIRRSNFTFDHFGLRHLLYNPDGDNDAASFAFPYADRSFDLVFAASLIPHLPLADAANYLAQSRRVMRDGGRALVSFLAIPESEQRDFTSVLGKGDGPYRFRFRHRGDGFYTHCDEDGNPKNHYMPDALGTPVAYGRAAFERLCRDAGFKVDRVLPGSWCREEHIHGYEDIAVLVAEV